MKKFDYTIIRGATVFFIALGAIFCSPSYAEEPKPGNRYNIIRPVYLMAVYNTDNRQLSREAASAYLHAVRYVDRYFVAFQCEIPTNTIMTIVGPAKKPGIFLFLPIDTLSAWTLMCHVGLTLSLLLIAELREVWMG